MCLGIPKELRNCFCCLADIHYFIPHIFVAYITFHKWFIAETDSVVQAVCKVCLNSRDNSFSFSSLSLFDFANNTETYVYICSNSIIKST